MSLWTTKNTPWHFNIIRTSNLHGVPFNFESGTIEHGIIIQCPRRQMYVVELNNFMFTKDS